MAPADRAEASSSFQLDSSVDLSSLPYKAGNTGSVCTMVNRAAAIGGYSELVRLWAQMITLGTTRGRPKFYSASICLTWHRGG
jgi:hypothetical protein